MDSKSRRYTERKVIEVQNVRRNGESLSHTTEKAVYRRRSMKEGTEDAEISRRLLQEEMAMKEG